jgi:hypothetical protein
VIEKKISFREFFDKAPKLNPNSPPNQTYLLCDKLNEADKDFEFQILAGHDRGRLGGEFLTLAIDFLSRRLRGVRLQ